VCEAQPRWGGCGYGFSTYRGPRDAATVDGVSSRYFSSILSLISFAEERQDDKYGNDDGLTSLDDIFRKHEVIDLTSESDDEVSPRIPNNCPREQALTAQRRSDGTADCCIDP